MGFEPFCFRQRHNRASDPVKAVSRELLDRDNFYKIVHAQPAAKTRRGAGGQNVIRAGGVVTCRLR